MSSEDEAGLVATFRTLSSASISDVTGQKCALASYLRPLFPGMKVAGRAITVSAEPGDPSKPTEAVEIARPGEVIVIDARGSDDSACWGGNDSIGSKHKGLAAVIVDGAIRDTVEIREMRFPTWAKAITPRTGGNKRGGQINVPIVCAGVEVNPGDIVMADDDGVVAVPKEEAAVVLEKSIQREALEKGIMKKVLGGATLAEALRAMHLKEYKRGRTVRDTPIDEAEKTAGKSTIPSLTDDPFFDMKFPLGSPQTRIISAAGALGRVVVARLRPGTDLLTGIKEVCRKHGVNGGVILCAFGSLQKCCLGYVRPTDEPHMRSGLDLIRLAGPIEFTTAQGMISESDKGELVLHVHGIVADRHNHCFGGHFIEGENLTLANVEVTIGEITGMKVGRKVEPELGWELLDPREPSK